MPQRLAFTLELKPETISEYVEHHKHVWPEVQQALRKAGFRQMTIFLLGARLFMVTEYRGKKPLTEAFEEYMRSPRCQEWDTLMRSFQKPVPEAKPGDWWAQMTEVYHHD